MVSGSRFLGLGGDSGSVLRTREESMWASSEVFETSGRVNGCRIVVRVRTKNGFLVDFRGSGVGWWKFGCERIGVEI